MIVREESLRSGFVFRRLVVSAFLLVLLALLLSGCGGATPNYVGIGEISGEIFASGGGGLIGDRVVTVTAGGRSTETASGLYVLKNVAPGGHTLRATASGYHDFEAPFVMPSGSLKYNISMTPIYTDVSGTATAPPASLDPPQTARPSRPATLRRLADRLQPSRAQALPGESPLAGATVRAYNWVTGAPVGNVTTTDAHGHFTLTGVPRQTDIVVRITRGALRLSAIVMNVGFHQPVMADTVSTLTAEAMGESFGMGYRVDSATFFSVRSAVNNEISMHNLATLDLRPGQGWLSADGFGSLAGLPPQHLLVVVRADIIAPLDGVARAKRAIAVVRNIGPSLITYGMPLVTNGIAKFNQKVPPFFDALTRRVAIIMVLFDQVDDASLLATGSATVTANGYTLNVDVEEGAPLHPGLEHTAPAVGVFTVTHVDGGVDYSGEATLSFESGRPVSLIDVRAAIADSDFGLVEVEIAIEPTWAETLLNDARDLKALSIHGSFDAALIQAAGALDVEFKAIARNGGWELAPSALQFVGLAGLFNEWVVMGGFGVWLDPEKVELNFETLGAATIAHGSHLHVDGTFAARVVAVPHETSSHYGDLAVAFDGQIKVPTRPAVDLAMAAQRTGFDELTLSDVRLRRGNLELTGDGTLVIEADNDTLAMNGSLSLKLTDDEGYEFLLEIALSGNAPIVNGTVRDPDGALVAELMGSGSAGITVYYFHSDGKITTESLI